MTGMNCLTLLPRKSLHPSLEKKCTRFNDGDKLAPLDNYLSRKILELHKISDYQASTLSEAVNYLEIDKKVKPMDIMRKLKSVVKDIDFDLPVLNEFLGIKDLNYFINTAVYNNVLEKKIFESKKAKSQLNKFLHQ